MARIGWNRLPLASALALAAALSACGGGGGGSAGQPGGEATTRFVGNLAELTTPARASTTAPTGTGIVVCVEGTTVCTTVDMTGGFTLEAGVDGDVVLRFTAPDFTARLMLSDIPAGATVHITDVRCSLLTGRCSAAAVEVDSPETNAAPVCDGALARPAVLWPPNHSLVPIAITGVVDPDGDRVSIVVSDVFQDEPVDEADDGAGNTAPDASLQPPAVRAERSGRGDGRVYHLLFTASDGHGGVCSGMVEVCVPHDQGHGSACGDDGGQFDSLG